MGALPKNKITSAERGKRRSGNRPSLVKNLGHANVPIHKMGLVAQIFQTIGINSPVSSQVTKQAAKNGSAQNGESAKAKSKAAPKTTIRPTAKPDKAQRQPAKDQAANVKAQQKSSRQVQDRG